MQLLHKREDYAFLFMREMALDARSYVSIDQFARRHHIAASTVKQCAQALSKSGLIKGREGSRGGYQLTRSADQITFQDIISSVGGVVEMSACEKDGHACRLGNTECAFKQSWSGISNHINDLLAHKTLADLVSA